MNTFKIGDRVRIVKHEDFPDNFGIEEVYIGVEGTVMEMDGACLVVVSDLDSMPWVVPPEMAEPAPQVSDRTALEEAEQIIRDLLAWELFAFGGSDAVFWERARRFVAPNRGYLLPTQEAHRAAVDAGYAPIAGYVSKYGDDTKPGLWDYATGQEYVRIEEVNGNKIVSLIVELPISFPDAEIIAEAVCQAHNRRVIGALTPPQSHDTNGHRLEEKVMRFDQVLDQAQYAFDVEKTVTTAYILLQFGIIYWHDDLIGDETLEEDVLKPILDWLSQDKMEVKNVQDR